MTRWLLGLATLWPLVYIVFFCAVIASAVLASPTGDPDEFLLVDTPVLFTLHLLTMLVIVVLLVVYLVDAYRNGRVPDDRRTFWAVVLFLGSVIAMPVYWWLYIRPTAEGS